MITILFLAANPSDSALLRIDEEIRAVDQALRQAAFRDRFAIEQHWAVRVTDLQALLLRVRPDIVHFSGHGGGAGEIALEDGTGRSRPVPIAALQQLFHVLKDRVRCVVLNACYSEPQAAAIAEEIDCVVGMASDIEDAAAIGFSAAFYQALGYGKDVATAFAAGCVQIGLEQDEPSGTIEAHATAGAMVGAAGTPKLLARRVRASEIVFVPDQAPIEVQEAPSARPSGQGVQIGSVGGSISHSVIAGGDAGHITIAGSGQGESGTARPTLAGLARRLDAISRALAAINAQGEILGAVSPAAPFAAQGAAQSIADAAQRLSSPAAGSGTEAGPIMRRRIAEAGVLLRGIQASAGAAEASVTESAGGYAGKGKLAGELSALCTQVEEAAAWADTLWPAE